MTRLKQQSRYIWRKSEWEERSEEIIQDVNRDKEVENMRAFKKHEVLL